MKDASGKGKFYGSTMPLQTCYTFGCSLARIRSSIFVIFVIAVKKGSAEQFEDATRPTRRAFNLGRNADHTDEQRDRWADWELERFEWMAFFDPQSLSRRNKRAPPCLRNKQPTAMVLRGKYTRKSGTCFIPPQNCRTNDVKHTIG